MESLKNYCKSKVGIAKHELQEHYNNKEITSNEAIILVKLLNTIKSECDTLTNENLSKDDKFERGVTIEQVTNYLQHYKELQPVIQKYFEKKHLEEKYNLDR